VERVAGTEGTKGQRFRLRAWFIFIRVGRRPEFRVAILACVIWLLLLRVYQPWERQGYQPWNSPPRYQSSLVADAAFFFWCIGFDAVGNNPLAVLVGLAVITVLVYIVGWVVRSFAVSQFRQNRRPSAEIAGGAAHGWCELDGRSAGTRRAKGARRGNWIGPIPATVPFNPPELLATDPRG